MAADVRSTIRPDYELVDAGELRRLERFGPHVVDRPAATALEWRRAPEAWRAADLRFDGERWLPPDEAIEPWTVSIDGLVLELRPTASGGLGLYPEHAANLAWVAARVADRLARPDDARGSEGPPRVLNLFAHSGLVTLAAARAGAAVTHVDAARTAVAWARRNAELSGLAARPIRWIVDDAGAFVAREARRGRRYDGIILDPPSFGRAGRRRWTIADELPPLLAGCRQVAADDAFLLLTAHTAGLDGDALQHEVRLAFGRLGAMDVAPLALEATSAARLELGWAVRSGR